MLYSFLINVSDVNYRKDYVNQEWEKDLISNFVEELLPQEHNYDSY